MFRRSLIAMLMIVLIAGPAFAQVVSGAPQQIALKAGFNFVAFTVKPSMNAAALKQANAAIEEIYGFSAASGAFISVSEGTLSTLAAGKGYIIKAASAANISVAGEAVGTLGAMSLKTGFNLIGISRDVAAAKFGDLMKLSPAVRGLYKWNASSGSFITVLKGASGLAELVDTIDPTLTAGQAYFLNASSDTTLAYDNGVISLGGASISPGYSNGVIVTDNEDIQAILHTFATLEEFNPMRGGTAAIITKLTAAEAFSPDGGPVRAISGTKSGNYSGIPYSVTYSIVLYNSQGREMIVARPNEVSKFTTSITGTIGSVECQIATTCENIVVSSYVAGQSVNYSCHQVQSGKFTRAGRTFNYALDLNATYAIDLVNATVAISNATGTGSITAPSGWSIELSYNGTTAAGTVKKDGVAEGSVSVSTDGTIVITDHETQKSVTISKTGITKNF